MALTIQQVNDLKPAQSVWHYNRSWGNVHEAKIRTITNGPTVLGHPLLKAEMHDGFVWDESDFLKPGVFLTEQECRQYAKENPSRIDIAEERDRKLRERGEIVPGEDDDEEVGEDPDED